MSKRSWYEFKAAAGGEKETTLFLYDSIGGFGVSASEFVNDLKAIPGKRLGDGKRLRRIVRCKKLSYEDTIHNISYSDRIDRCSSGP